MTPANLPTSRVRAVLRAALWLVPLGVAGNVALALLSTDRHVLDVVASLPAGPLAVAGALAVVPWITNALRLQLWASFVGHALGFWSALRVVLGGLLGSAVTPTGSGGAALKWALLSRRGVSGGTAGTLLLVETFENAVFMGIAVPAAIVVTAATEIPVLQDVWARALGGGGPAAASAVAVGAGLVAAAVLVTRGHLGRRARRWTLRARRAARRHLRDAKRVGADVVRRGKGRLALGVLLAGVQWTARYSVATAVIAFLDVPIRPVLFWLLQWVTFTLMNAVPTPGAAGGAEAAFAVLFSPFVPVDLLGLATAAWRLVLFYGPLAVAAVLFVGLGRWTAAPGATEDGAENRRRRPS